MISSQDAQYIVNADHYMDYLIERGRIGRFKVPETVVMCFQNSLVQRILEQSPEAEKLESNRGSLYSMGGRFGLAFGFGLGASVAAMLMEELSALGVRNFYLLGTAGSLHPKAAVGDFVFVDAAVREDGVSDHYVASGAGKVLPIIRSGVLERMAEALSTRKARVHWGATWSTCAPYRESREKLAQYADQNTLAVEMEVAALAAVAQEKSLGFGAVLVISDLLFGERWVPCQSSPEVLESLLAGYSVLRELLIEQNKC
jgi:uridine phosphorylase